MQMKTLLPVVAAICLASSAAEARKLPRKAPLPPMKPAELKAAVTKSAEAHGIPPALAHGVVKVESSYRCRVKNPKSSATGIMQVVKGTAKLVGIPHSSLKNCTQGLEAGMRYLKKAFNKAGGDWCLAASLYERGTSAQPGCNEYGRKVLRFANLTE